MPTVRKLNPPTSTAKPVTGGSILGRIKPVKQVDSGGIKVSLYGRAKTGKTRLISTFPKPILILGGEDGTRSIRTVEDVYFTRIVSRRTPKESLLDENGEMNAIYLDELSALLKELPRSEYKTVGLDTASALSDVILADLMGVVEIPAQNSWGMASREQYGQQSLQLKTILRALLNLPQNVVITAHERNFNEEGGTDLIAPTVGSALSPSVSGWLNGACEYICQTFIREKFVMNSRTLNGKEVKTKQKLEGVDYCLRVGPHPVYMTGFRLPPGQELPELIEDPHYDKLMQLISPEK